MRRFESSRPSQRVRSLGCYFPVGENRRHSRRLGWGAPVSGPQFLAFRLLRGGFLAPVSGGDFPISVSGVQRPVRQQTESRLHPPRTSALLSILTRWAAGGGGPGRGRAARRLARWHARGQGAGPDAGSSNRRGLLRPTIDDSGGIRHLDLLRIALMTETARVAGIPRQRVGEAAGRAWPPRRS